MYTGDSGPINGWMKYPLNIAIIPLEEDSQEEKDHSKSADMSLIVAYCPNASRSLGLKAKRDAPAKMMVTVLLYGVFWFL